MSANWVAWATVLACLSVIGCSGRGGTAARETPLPAGADPGDLFNVRPEAPVAVVDARPFYTRDNVSAAPTEARRANQARAGEKVPSSEFNVKQYRAAERKQSQESQRKEWEDEWRKRLKAIENRKSLLAPGDLPHEVGNIGLHALDRATDAEKNLLEANRPPTTAASKLGAGYDFLVLSGGGSRSLYSYGVVCGWSDSGTMPEFQVITGVSGGSFAAAVTFAGPEFLCDLRRIFLGIDQTRLLRGDAWDRKRFPHPFGVGTESVASSAKIRKLAQQVLGNPAFFRKVAAEHAKGRRLYVGTTNLDTQRFVVWDMGAIASEGTAASRKLFEDVLVASSAIPPLMEPSRITVTIDGKRYEELHVDGGTTRNLFLYPPSDWPGDEEDKKTGYTLLAGARIHVVIGGKVYETPEGTPLELLPVGMKSIGTLLSAVQRAELARIFSYCLDRDMTMRIAAIPEDYGPMFPPSEFDPAKSAKLFCEGYTRAQDGTNWDERPPERAVSEDRARRGSVFSTTPGREVDPLSPVRPPAASGAVRILRR